MTLRDSILADYPNARRQLDRVPDELLSEFKASLDEGTDPVWAEMATVRCGPTLKTETSYATRDRFGSLLKQFGGDEKMLDRYAKAWKAKGVTVTGNEVWLPHLANGKDDVECLARPGEVLETQRRIAEKRNMPLEGAVNVKHRNDLPPPPDVPLAHDIVTRIAREEAKTDPSFLRNEETKREKYHEIVERHKFTLD